MNDDYVEFLDGEIEGLSQEEIEGLTIMEEEQYFRTYGDTEGL